MDTSIIFIALLFSVTMVNGDFVFRPDYQRTPLGDSIDATSMKILKEMYDVAQDKNVVTSPLGLAMLLSLFSEGAAPDSKTEIVKFLGGADAKQTGDWYKQLSDTFSSIDPDILSIANKVYVARNYTFNEKFEAIAREYHTEFDKVDFTNPPEAAAIINQWANIKTKGHIPKPIEDDALSPSSKTALFNIIFFNGHWDVPFKTEDTKEKDFHVSRDNIIKKPMMHLLQPLFYTESAELGAKLIELPYKETGFRMVVVLPDEIDGLPSVLEKAAQKGLISDVFNLSPVGRDMDLDMPKFDIRTRQDYDSILPKLGVSKMFSEPVTGIVKDTSTRVNKVFQEAFIKVNEEGATAGAFTGAVLVPTSSISRPPPPLKFTVDHPFMYAIFYNDIMLFAGALSE